MKSVAVSICTVLALSAAAAAGGQPAESEWTQYRGDAGHTGVSPDSSIKPPLRLLWSYRTDGDTSGDAATGLIVAGGKIFVNIHNTRSILALDALTGRFAWEYSDNQLEGWMTPAFGDGRVFLWKRRGKASAVAALDAADGRVLWERALKPEGKDEGRAGPVAAGGQVFAAEGGGDPAVICLDGKTGAVVWRRSLGSEGGQAVVPPCVAGGRVFVCTRGNWNSGPAGTGCTFALDQRDGKILWKKPGIISDSSPVSDGKALLCESYRAPQRGTHLLDAKTGDMLWSAGAGNSLSAPTLTDDRVIIRTYYTSPHALSRKDGKPLWNSKVPMPTGCGTPAVSGDYAYFGTGVTEGRLGDSENIGPWQLVDAPREKGMGWSIYALDLKTGAHSQVLSGACNFCGDPAIAYGRLYVNGRDGRVYCLAPAKPGEPVVPEAKDQSPNASPEEVKKLLASEPADKPRPGLDWPMCGGSPDRIGLDGVTLNPPLEGAWKLDLGGRVYTAAAIRDGRVFAASDSGRIYAVAAAGGKKIWDFQTGAQVRCSPAVAGGTVYCGSDDGKFYALAAGDGKPLWTFECGGPVRASPAVVGGIVIFAADDYHTYALDRSSGRKLWAFRSNYYSHTAPPVVHGDTVYAAQWVDWTHALDIVTGRPKWRSFASMSIEALAFAGDRLYVRTPYWIAELDPATGQRQKIGPASYAYGGLAIISRQVLNTGVQGQYGTPGLCALDFSGGGKELTWGGKPLPTMEGAREFGSRSLGADLGAMGAPLALGDRIAAATLKGDVVLLTPTGARLWTGKLGGTCHAPPVAAGGLLVVGCDDGHLYAFREKAR